jgi:phosphotransferase system HPr (HPr) family protein
MVKVRMASENGLHARPASELVAKATQFKSEITITAKGIEANGKSIINVLGLGVQHNDEVTIKAVGEDAQEAEKSIAQLIEASHA